MISWLLLLLSLIILSFVVLIISRLFLILLLILAPLLLLIRLLLFLSYSKQPFRLYIWGLTPLYLRLFHLLMLFLFLSSCVFNIGRSSYRSPFLHFFHNLRGICFGEFLFVFVLALRGGVFFQIVRFTRFLIWILSNVRVGWDCWCCFLRIIRFMIFFLCRLRWALLD